MTQCCSDALSDLSRRGFVKLALGAGAALWVNFNPTVSRAAGGTDALLLSCMDYRLTDDIVRYMGGRNMTDKYDHVVLAGASLGALQDKMPSWGQTFWDHVKVAIDLHHISKVIVMDHRDCGAYKVFLGPEAVKDKATETASHVAKLKALGGQISAKYPSLAVELLIMDLEGKVETVT